MLYGLLALLICFCVLTLLKLNKCLFRPMGTLSTCGTAETMGAPKVVPVVAFLGLAVFTLAQRKIHPAVDRNVDFRNEKRKLKGIIEYANDTVIRKKINFGIEMGGVFTVSLS